MNHRASIVQQARAIADAAQAEGRALTEAEQLTIDRLWAAVDAFDVPETPASADCEWEDFPP
jgi:hypothetical protein